MLQKTHALAIGLMLVAFVAAPAVADSYEMQEGTPDIKSVGPLAFGEAGILFIGDPLGAAVFAIDTKDTAGSAENVKLNVEGIDKKVAGMLGTTPDDILINDLAVNPETGSAYLSVSRGRGPDATPVVLQVDDKGNISELSLKNVLFSKAELPNPPENAVTGEGKRRRNNRLESITDLLFIDGQLFIAGLSNEEFASKLRSIPFPFQKANGGTSIEIFHGAHGRLETRSPIRTFAAYEIDEVPHLLAAYTCTPLVKIPVAMLHTGEKVTGTTVAELGNHNRPLDMVFYQKEGEDYILMANSARGLMKISTENISNIDGINEKISDTAGLEYETIDEVEGVVQLDHLNAENALALINTESGMDLRTLPLP
jgi:hypothetical protein